MQVDTDSALRNEVNLAVTRVGQALKDKGLDAKVFSPAHGVLEIEGVDLQACGGTHVRSTGEIGAMVVGKIESKGRQNRRIAITLGA